MQQVGRKEVHVASSASISTAVGTAALLAVTVPLLIMFVIMSVH